jgi:hypothetical protein
MAWLALNYVSCRSESNKFKLGRLDSVFIQNQTGNHPKRWDKRGVIMKCEGYDQYQVMVDGSRRLTRRNRKFLRPFTPYKPDRMVINTSADAQVRQVPQQQAKPQQRQQQQDDQQQHDGQQHHVQLHMGYQYQPLSAAPASGTLQDMLPYWIPTEAGGDQSDQPQQDAADHGNGNVQAKDTHDDDGVIFSRLRSQASLRGRRTATSRKLPQRRTPTRNSGGCSIV